MVESKVQRLELDIAVEKSAREDVNRSVTKAISDLQRTIWVAIGGGSVIVFIIELIFKK